MFKLKILYLELNYHFYLLIGRNVFFSTLMASFSVSYFRPPLLGLPPRCSPCRYLVVSSLVGVSSLILSLVLSWPPCLPPLPYMGSSSHRDEEQCEGELHLGLPEWREETDTDTVCSVRRFISCSSRQPALAR